MGRVIRIVDWLAARGTAPTAPAGAALPKTPRADNGWDECLSCVNAESSVCDHCEEGELYNPGDEEAASTTPQPLAA